MKNKQNKSKKAFITLKILGGEEKMSEQYDEGYEDGYEDAKNGKESMVTAGTKFLGMFLADDGIQQEYEDGYQDGYNDGQE